MKNLVKLFLSGKTILYILHLDGEAQAPKEFEMSEDGLKQLAEQLESDEVGTVKTDSFEEEHINQLKEAGIDVAIPEKKEVTKEKVIAEYVFTPKKKDVKKKDEATNKEMIGKKIIRSFPATVKDLGDGRMEAIISNEALDRHGENLLMSGGEFTNYMKNPIMAAFHDYNKPSVGRAEKLQITEGNMLKATFKWAKDENPEAKILHDLYKNEFQFAFSIGFIAKEMQGHTFTVWEMIEFSPVLVPANADALLLAKKKGLDTELLNSQNKEHMKLSAILAKSLNDLTFAEIKYLREHADKLTADQKAQFAEVLSDDEPTDDVDAKISTAVKEAMTASMEEIKTAFQEAVNQDTPAMKDINTGKKKGVKSKATPQMKFLYYAKGLQTRDFSQYREVMKDAMDTSSDDTSVLVPPAEFLTEVERLEEEFGVARRFAQLRRSTSGNGISYLQGDDDLEIFFTDEAGRKKSTKLGYARKLLAWRKAAGILPITDELTEDSAVDLWNDATQRFARAYARVEDQLVFTQASGSAPINPGILHVAGTNEVVMTGTGFNDVTYDDLVDMETGVPTASHANARWYFHRTLLGALKKLKDEDGVPLWQRAMADGTPATLLGKPYELVEVMPGISDSAPDTAFMVFGDLRYVTLGERTGLNIKIFDTGLVGDPDEETQGDDLNLLTQDMQAMRAVKRFNAIVRFPAAFSVLKTGDGAS